MHVKKLARMKRAARARRKIRELEMPRLTVHRTAKHIYAQLIAADGASVLSCASSLDKELKSKGLKAGGNIEAAKVVGEAIANRVQAKGIKRIAFDWSGFKYHGRIKALADAARNSGLEF